jgi:CRP-like cAMP-binding protein
MITGRLSTFRNEILASLPDDDITALMPMLTRVSLVSQQVLHERETPIVDVFFIENGIASLSADTLDEGQVEVGLTGWEGFVGASVILNPDALSVHRAFVQVNGSAYRMSAVALRAAIERSGRLRDRCLRYVDLLMVQTSQAAACNARHNLPERLARWLLMTRDRVDTHHLPVTQEFLSIMLGVRRAGVSLAASALQTGGLIRQSRGRITIIDNAGLEAASCDCYRIIQQSRNRILPHWR